jgi:hypothetical protein
MKLNPIVVIVLAAASVVGACEGSFSNESRSGAWTQAQMTAFHTFKERAAGSRADVVRSVVTAFPVAFDFDAMQPIPVAGPLITRADQPTTVTGGLQPLILRSCVS